MIIRNRVAIFGWIFTITFLIFCALITYVLIRDGSSNIQINPPSNTDVYPPWFVPLIMFAFWIVGITAAIHMWHVPIVRVSAMPSGLVLVELVYPLRTIKHQFATAEVQQAIVIESKDSEGDAYFECRFQANNGFTTIIAESSSKEQCELSCKQFNEAIERHRRC